jgi:hypothetical protein
MEEEVVRVGVEVGAEHAGTILPHTEVEDVLSEAQDGCKRAKKLS